MFKLIIQKTYQCFLVKFYPDCYEFITIERVNSSGTVIEYSK